MRTEHEKGKRGLLDGRKERRERKGRGNMRMRILEEVSGVNEAKEWVKEKKRVKKR